MVNAGELESLLPTAMYPPLISAANPAMEPVETSTHASTPATTFPASFLPRLMGFFSFFGFFGGCGACWL